MSENRNSIFIGGIHGVGKTTFINEVKAQYPSIVCLSCSTLLNWSNPAHKEVDNVDANQQELLVNLPHFIEDDKSYLLDGHFCLLTAQGRVERVPIEVFQAIRPRMIVVLEANLELISQRLQTRDNKAYAIPILDAFQQEEVRYAREVAQTLCVPFLVCADENRCEVMSEVLKLLRSRSMLRRKYSIK